MDIRKTCIFHHPKPVFENGKSGSEIRPYQMLKAFKEIGYEVLEITGFAKERKQKIEEIKELINKGLLVDFVYSESSTEPTLLTEKNHIPVLSFDFKFFKFCADKNIQIGLFYRDMYWKFPEYKKSVGLIKNFIANFYYKYDIKKYNKYIDVLYLPTKKINDIINAKCIIKELPPGCPFIDDFSNISTVEKKSLSLVYVGGIGYYYDLTKLLEVMKELPFCDLTICCRENEWDANKAKYTNLLGDNIQIIHKSGNELKKVYNKSDIALLFFESSGYRSYAMPIKLFEYIGYAMPVIATENCSAGDFVSRTNVGWTIPFKKESLLALLQSINFDFELLVKKKKTLEFARENNSWKARAKQVESDLIKLKR